MQLLGIDVSATTINIASANHQTDPRTWPITTINLTDNWSQQLTALVTPPTLAVLEPTGWHYALPIAQVLRQAGAQVLYTSNNTTAKTRTLYISQHKTDRADARAIAMIALLHTQHVPIKLIPFFDPSNETDTTLRLTMTLRERTAKQRNQAINRLKQLLHGVWPSLARSHELWIKLPNNPLSKQELITARDTAAANGAHHATIKAIAKLADSLPDWLEPSQPQRWAASMLSEEIIHHNTTIEALTQQLETLIWADPIANVTRLWYTVPGAGAVRIAALHIATHCHAADITTDEFRAAVGCHPIKQESGALTTTHHAKTGYRPAKKVLHLWTLSLIQYSNNPVADYYNARRDTKNAIHSARGKLARILSGIARNGTPCNWQTEL